MASVSRLRVALAILSQVIVMTASWQQRPLSQVNPNVMQDPPTGHRNQLLDLNEIPSQKVDEDAKSSMETAGKDSNYQLININNASSGQNRKLPYFITHPKDSFIIKSRSASLNCSVIFSTKAYFSCNGEALAKSIKHSEQNQIDATTGALIRTLNVDISREQVEEYFGKFECHCDAWSEFGQVSSDTATVSIGFLNKEFEVPPYSQSVEYGQQVELRCHPPRGHPKPWIYWMKERQEIDFENEVNYLQAADGHLIIVQVGDGDIGNYTCVAENVVNRRLSPPARIDIFVDGGWSSWSPWTDCDARCGRGKQRRHRVCNNPTPSLNGQYCFGEAEEINQCVNLCPGSSHDLSLIVDGGWSPWSGWSPCSPDCINYRMRTCTSPVPAGGGTYCPGRDQISASCGGGLCRDKVQGDSPPGQHAGMTPPITTDGESMLADDLSLMIGLCVGVLVFLTVTLISVNLIRRKGRSQSIYNMASLVYRDECHDKDGSGGKREETNFSFPGARVFHHNSHNCSSYRNGHLNFGRSNNAAKSEDKQILQLDFPTSATNSPFNDKRSSAAVMQLPPPLVPRVPSPSESEHQYDVPFSHLTGNKLTGPGGANSLPGSNMGGKTSTSSQNHQTNSGYSDIGHPGGYSTGSEEGGRHSSTPWSMVDRSSELLGPSVASHAGLSPAPWNANSGLTPLIKHRPWSPSERSVNSSSFCSESSGIVSSYPRNSVSSPSVLPPGIDTDSFTIATVSDAGCKLSLPEWGVSLLIPEGSLEPGFTEEVFLAVMRESRDRPTVTDRQTILSPVVLAGPPRLSFKKPVVVSFNHCASLQHSGWEIGVYHCDSLFTDTRDSAWVKLVSIGQESVTCPVYTHLDFNTCFILTDFLTRFCLVGQSESSAAAVKVLKILTFGKQISLNERHNGSVTSNKSWSGTYLVKISVVEDTLAAVESVLRSFNKEGFKQLDKPKSLYFQDQPQGERSPGDDLTLSVCQVGPAWSLKQPKPIQELEFRTVWSPESSSQFGSDPDNGFSLELEWVQSGASGGPSPLPPPLQLDMAVCQKNKPEYKLSLNICCDTSKLPSPLSRASNCSSMVASSSGCSSLPSNGQAFKLAQSVKLELCRVFNSGEDWRTLALALRLDRFLEFYGSKRNPTECILSLWEAQQSDQAAITDLLNIVRLLGRQEVASKLEKEVGSWV